jgi:hypothetical protein
MPSIKGIPTSPQVDLKLGAKVHRIRNRRHSNVSQITGCVPSWNVQAPAERDCQVGEVAATQTLSLEASSAVLLISILSVQVNVCLTNRMLEVLRF